MEKRSKPMGRIGARLLRIRTRLDEGLRSPRGARALVIVLSTFLVAGGTLATYAVISNHAVAALVKAEEELPEKPDEPNETAHPNPPKAATAPVPVETGGDVLQEIEPEPSAREHAKREYVKGLRLFATNHNSEAINSFKKAIEIDPRFPDAHRALGSIYVRLGNLKGMCREFKIYAKLAPHASDTTKIKGELAKYAATVSKCRSDLPRIAEGEDRAEVALAEGRRLWPKNRHAASARLKRVCDLSPGGEACSRAKKMLASEE